MALTILLIGKFAPTCGQVSTLNLWLCVGLARRGYRVIVCSDSNFKQKQLVSFGDCGNVSSFLDELGLTSTVLYSSYLADEVFFPFSDLSFTSMLSSANEIVENHKPDILITSYLEPYALVGHILSIEYDIPHIATHAGTDAVRLCGIPRVEALYKRLLPRTTRFIPKTVKAAALASDTGGPTPSPYYPPADRFRFNANDWRLSLAIPDQIKEMAHEEPVFGYYGKFTHGKSLLEIVQAFSEYRRRHSSGFLWLVGGNVSSSLDIYDLIESCGVRNCSLVTHFLPNWHIPDVINACTAMFYMKSNYNVTEHNSIVVREIVACGCPVIVTNESIQGSHRSADCNPLLINVHNHTDIEQIIDAMRKSLGIQRCEQAKDVELNASRHEQYVASWETIINAAGEKR